MSTQIKIEGYEKLIWSIVLDLISKIPNKFVYKGLEDDLFQEGFIALIKAEKKFDETRNVKFSTFAYHYIYGLCLNYIKKEIISMDVEDIDNSPIVSSNDVESDFCSRFNLIEEINKEINSTNKKVSKEETKILEDRLVKNLSLKKCAELNNCSVRKINNFIKKYENVIKKILI